jgi:mono/diheme cytochrome c family protein
MRQSKQIIAASGLAAILLMLLSWPGAAAHRAGTLRAAQQANDQTGDTPRDARATFESRCATCHGKDGRAKTLKAKFNKARDLTDAAWQSEASDERIYNSIANGRGKKMPAFAKKLSRAEMDALVVHVRSLKN